VFALALLYLSVTTQTLLQTGLLRSTFAAEIRTRTYLSPSYALWGANPAGLKRLLCSPN